MHSKNFYLRLNLLKFNLYSLTVGLMVGPGSFDNSALIYIYFWFDIIQYCHYIILDFTCVQDKFLEMENIIIAIAKHFFIWYECNEFTILKYDYLLHNNHINRLTRNIIPRVGPVILRCCLVTSLYTGCYLTTYDKVIIYSNWGRVYTF